MKSNYSDTENKNISDSQEAIKNLWNRLESIAKLQKKRISKCAEEAGISSTVVYESLRAVKNGKEPRDTDLYIVLKLADSLGTNIDELLYGVDKSEQIEVLDGNKIEPKIFKLIIDTAKGDPASLFLMLLPYLSEDERESVRSDVLTRF